MVNGLRAKSSRSTSTSTVQASYLVNIQEIRPWPPSQSLKSIRSAVIQWDNGEKSTGTTSSVVPTTGFAAEEGKIEFNESFKLSVILTREIGKAGDHDAFQKNCLEFNLYEPRRDKTVKGQLLGSAIVNLADYGVIKSTVRLNAPINCTRSFKNTVQPILYFDIQPLRKGQKNFSSDEPLSREMSMDRNDLESISSMTKEEYNEQTEIASFTDDDISSHSSATITNSSSSGDCTPENNESSYENLKDGNKNHGNLVDEAELSSGAIVNEPAPETDALRDEKSHPVSRAGVIVRKEFTAHAQLQTDFRAANGSARHFEERSINSESKIDKLQEKVKILEEELREAAAAEVALYSIVAEHGSSMNKLHAPARRLFRLYMHGCKDGSRTGMSRTAKSAASGLVLVAKACGNDVPRLTFWLSNCMMLRAILSQGSRDSKLSLSARAINAKVTSSSSRWTEPSSGVQNNGNAICRRSDDCMDSDAFISALEKIEAWIFSRVVESIWWQTLTPHMQSSAAKEIDISKPGKSFSKSSDGQNQGNFSLVLWKKAFKDAFERLCPIRAAGHECGCLPVLAKLVMEQCVARLDVAMFNAILRESDDDIPTDPVSDPISDPRVLPIIAGKSCFGAGVQLKNVIGNWSRLFSEVFGIDEDDSIADEGDQSSISDRQDMSFRSFNLLNALSDLLMLPKDMLISKSIRQEICPAFGAQLIKRILDTYVPDEFCPDPVPIEVLQALEADEDASEDGEGCFTNFPCTASPPTYLPPSAASLACYIGEIGKPHLTRTTSSVLRKSYTSDDELDEIDSPLNSICLDGVNSTSSSMPTKSSHKKNGAENAIRYQLLREVWKDGV